MDVFLQDSSSTTGAGLSGLAFNTANLKAYYRKGATGTLTAITLATQTVGGAWSSGGFVEVDATNAKGLYRFDIPDTILASSPAAIIHFYGASNLAQNFSELEIVAYDPFNATSLGLSRIDAAITSRMATFTLPTNFSALSINASGQVDVIKVAGVTQTGGDIYGLSVTIASYIDTEITTIITQTGAAAIRAALGLASANLDTQLSNLQADTDNIQTRIPAALTGAGNMKSDPQAINGDATSAANLAKTTRAIGRGTVNAGATTTSIPTSAFTPTGVDADQFKDRVITFDADTATTALRGEVAQITTNTGAANPTLTVTALTRAPASGDTFSVT